MLFLTTKLYFIYLNINWLNFVILDELMELDSEKNEELTFGGGICDKKVSYLEDKLKYNFPSHGFGICT